MTTFGKYRHLSRCATSHGHFVVLAIDHRTNLLNELHKHASHPVNDAEFVAFKQQVLHALAPYASGVLTDPAYGISHAIADGTLHGHMGLLAPVEVTDYDLHPSKRDVQFIPGWSVEQIKRVGGDGVKLLLPYHPEASDAVEKRTVVQHIVGQCARHDIPFFLEPIAYSRDPDKPLADAELQQITVMMAQIFSAMGVDVLKLQFPCDANQNSDHESWRAACAAVNAVCSVPWALLSGGVSFETFAEQARIACEAGASGVIVGRAVWAEAVSLHDGARAAFLASTGMERMQTLRGICAQHAQSWMMRTPAPQASTTWYLT